MGMQLDANSTLEMQAKPMIWDNTKFWTSKNTVIGAFAMCAVSQSPYVCPENLEQGVKEFADVFSGVDDVFETSCEQLVLVVESVIRVSNTICGWNNPKKGNHTISFTSRYESPHPDYDFIDLGALARNVAHTVTVLEKYDKAQDDLAQTSADGRQ